MKKMIIAICIGFFITLIIHSGFKSTETALAKSVLRLHVIANSDSACDQELKLKVRDRILREMTSLYDDSDSMESAKTITETNLDKIKEWAADEIKKQGYSYEVTVSLGKGDFPTKEYGNLILPAGSYEALKVEIGNATGKNWWCVLFPPLCFVDETCVSASSDIFSDIEKNGGRDLSEFVNKEKSSGVELKFKTYEIWQSSRKKLASIFKGWFLDINFCRELL
ncbi:MAG: stage II sporulation protein R [Clostridia bacterium]|nr:stage II sporulation protein R [Clostridia bacterium]